MLLVCILVGGVCWIARDQRKMDPAINTGAGDESSTVSAPARDGVTEGQGAPGRHPSNPSRAVLSAVPRVSLEKRTERVEKALNAQEDEVEKKRTVLLATHMALVTEGNENLGQQEGADYLEAKGDYEDAMEQLQNLKHKHSILEHLPSQKLPTR